MKSDETTAVEVLSVIEGVFAAYAKRDVDAVLRLFCQDPDVVVIGSRTGERRVGPAQIREQVEKDLKEASAITNRIVRPVICQAGSVAWAAVERETELQKEEQGLVKLARRLTVVLEKREDRWLIVQWHNSIAKS